MKKKNAKKGMTLIEVIVSLGLLGIVSIALLGILGPTAAMEKNTRTINTATYDVAAQLERGLYSMRSGLDITDYNYLTYGAHTLDFTLGGTDFSVDGSLIKSSDGQSGVELYAFLPQPKDNG